MTARLAEKLKRLIAAEGPIGIGAYMAACLGDPEHGYYATRDPLGAAGDFTTAPEISQMFGEIVGAWLVHVWAKLGQAGPIALVELGPGRGTLMADILRVVELERRLAARLRVDLRVHLVETSPVLRDRQREALAGTGFEMRWHDSLAQVPEGPLLVVANEFFDALPVRQFVRAEGRWRERVVGLDDEGRLAFGLGPATAPGPEAPDGAVREVRPAAEALVAEIAQRLVRHGGAALIVDYGHAGGFGDTLQAVRGHAFADPLAAPGEADLTAHVDFNTLARRAKAEGASAHGPMAQGDFLIALGLLERAGQLGAGQDAATQDAIRAAVERLAGPDEMGRLFKVLALTPPGLVPPPFGTGV